MTKPFSFRELVARIRAVTRRSASTESSGEINATQLIGPLEIDRRTRRVRLSGAEILLTAKEFDLLLPRSIPELCSLGPTSWRTSGTSTGSGRRRLVDAHVAVIRKKLGDQRWIEAVRGDRVPPGASGVRWRLVAVFVGITAVVLAAHDIPLAYHLQQVERQPTDHRPATRRLRDRRTFGTRVEDGTAATDPALQQLIDGYRADTGGRVVITDRTGIAVGDLGRGGLRREQLRDSPGDRRCTRWEPGDRRATVGDARLSVALCGRARPVRRGGDRHGPDHLSGGRGWSAGPWSAWVVAMVALISIVTAAGAALVLGEAWTRPIRRLPRRDPVPGQRRPSCHGVRRRWPAGDPLARRGVQHDVAPDPTSGRGTARVCR